MKRIFYFAAATSITSLLAIAGCDGEEPVNPSATTTTTTGTGGAGGSGGDGGGGGVTTGNYVRIHYRLQGEGDVTTWGAHFWGAGSTSPDWGSPKLFSMTDDFGGYTDIEVTAVMDSEDAWLGLIPVQCTEGNCIKDVETGVRWIDLYENPENPNIREAWITQGQAVLREPPGEGAVAYEIGRAKDFIDLGNGDVRLMFRVAPGSTGVVEYGSAPGTVDGTVTWSETDDINKNGLVIQGLPTGAPTYYRIRTTLVTESGEMSDETDELDLTPIAVEPVTTTADWATWGSSGIMYQLIVRTFADGGTPQAVVDPENESGIDPAAKDGIGDLVGLTAQLPYLADLGVDAIWMTPVFAAKSYHGYDTTDFYSIDPAVGTIQDFRTMAQEAEALGIKIIVDLVQNHVATVNPWFEAAIDPSHPDHETYRDWFVWSDEYSNMFTDPHPWDASAVIWACQKYSCYHQIFGAQMPELNFRNPAVRAKMKDIAEFWVQLGADGFRLDASKHIEQFDDINETALDLHGTHVWWKEFNAFVKRDIALPQGASPVLLAGENRWDDPAVADSMVPYGGDMDSQFDFPFRSVLSSFVNGQTDASADFVQYFNTLRTMTAAVENGGNPNHIYQRFLSNHDLERPATQFEAMAGQHLEAVLKQAATVVLTVPGMPVIYYGEELGKKGKRDKWYADGPFNEPWDHDEYIREPMSWFQEVIITQQTEMVDDGTGNMVEKVVANNIDFATTNTTNSVMEGDAGVCVAPNPDYPYVKFMSNPDMASYEAQMGVQGSLFEHYKRLIAIRKANPVMTDPQAVLTKTTDDATWYVYTIGTGLGQLTVVLNRTATAQTYSFVGLPKSDLITQSNAALSFSVPAYGALILQ